MERSFKIILVSLKSKKTLHAYLKNLDLFKNAIKISDYDEFVAMESKKI